MKEWLAGKKTYLVAVASLIGVSVSWATGDLTTLQAIQSAVGLILATTIRHGIG